MILSLRNLFLILFLIISSISYGQQIVYVNQAVAVSGDGTSWGTAVKTIEEAIDVAADGSEIWVAKGEYIPFNGSSRPWFIEKNVSFVGGFNGVELGKNDRDVNSNVTVLKGASLDDILFNILYDNLEIKYNDLVLTHVENVISSGVNNAKVHLNNCEIFDIDYAAFQVSGEYIIEFCEFEGFNDISYGHVLSAGNLKSVKLLNSKFNCKNIITSQVKDEITISDCIFEGVSQVTNAYSSADLRIENSKIIGNGATQDLFYGQYNSVVLIGDTIENHNGYLIAGGVATSTKIEKCKFNSIKGPSLFNSGNNNSDFIISDSKFENCKGSIWGSFKKIELLDSEFLNDSAFYFNGGLSSKLSVVNCSFDNVINNSSDFLFNLGGGDQEFEFKGSIVNNFQGGFCRSYYKKISIENCEFKKSKFENFIYSGAPTVNHFSLNNCQFESNDFAKFVSIAGSGNAFSSIRNVKFSNNNFLRNSGFMLGNFSGNNFVENIIISENKELEDFVQLSGSTGSFSFSNIKLDNQDLNTFINNIQGYNNYYSAGDILLNNIVFDSVNFANVGFTCGKSNLQIENSYFSKLKVENSPFIAIVNNLTLSNCQFVSIRDLNYPLFSNSGNSYYVDCEFKNVHTSDGSQYPAIAMLSNKLKVDNCLFEDINGGYYGSALNISGNSEIVNSKFLDCKGKIGSSIYSRGRVNVSNSVFESNYSKIDGGAIVSSDTLIIFNSKFLNNKSENNGGAILSSGFVKIQNTNFNNNVSLNGGAIYNTNKSGFYLLNNCQFKNNNGSEGSAINNSEGKLKIFNSLFEGNSSIIGTIYNNSNVTEYEIVNSIFYNNISERESLVRIAPNGADNCIIKNSVFYGNKQTGNNKNTIANFVYNSILWNNQLLLADSSTGIYQSANGKKYNHISHSNIQGGFPGIGNLDLDPKFVDPENGDFRLSCESPLINKGSNQFSLDIPDAYGTPRIMADTVDMGAFEFPGDPAVAKSLPVPDFDFSKSAVCLKEPVRFLNNTDNKDYFTYKWNTGDSTGLITAIDTSYSYKKAGTYPVQLVATNACGKSVAVSKDLEIKPSFVPSINYKTTVCHGDTVSFTTNAVCANLNWQVTGGTILSGNGTNKVLVQWGSGVSGNGNVKLLATNCGNDAVCEFPVEIEIPIMPANRVITGDTLVCQGSVAKYNTMLRDFIPGAIFNWSVKGGSISGKNSGYGLDSVAVNWSSTDTLGVVYLSIENELVGCTTLDSFVVQLRPQFSLNKANRDFCVNSDFQFTTDKSGAFSWSFLSSGNTIDQSGLVKFGNLAGSAIIHVNSTNPIAFCNLVDTLNIVTHSRPVIDSIVGENEVNNATSYTYQVYYSGNESTPQWMPYKNNYSMWGNPVSVRWQYGEPYGFKVAVKSTLAGCYSDTVDFPVKPDYVYAVSGPDTVCILSLSQFDLNSDKVNTETISWKLNGVDLAVSDTLVSLEFDKGGFNILEATIIRKGKTYKSSKRVYVDFTPGVISANGPRAFNPQPGAISEYTITNPSNLDLSYNLTGSQNFTIADTVLSVVWNQTGPYQIKIDGSKAGQTCKAVPFTMLVNKAPVLSKDITLDTGLLCPNSIATYRIEADNLIEDLQWTLHGGGLILEEGKDFIKVQWGENAGTYTISATYERFGTQQLTKSIQINAPPVPVIKDVIICGTTPVNLSTTQTYQSYQWSSEPNGILLSDQQQFSISNPGAYSVKVTDQNGCTGVATKNITSVPDPIAKIISSESDYICEQAGIRTVKLSTAESPDYVYQWFVEGTQISGNNQSTYTFNQNLNTPGTYTYKVKVTSAGVCTKESSGSLTIRTTQQCSGTGGGGGGGTPCPTNVSFTVSGFQPFVFTKTSSQPVGFTWDFGDNSPGVQGTSASHEYNDLGNYTVTLTNGCARQEQTVIVPILARFSAPELICRGMEVQFTNYSANLPGYEITDYLWDFGDGTTSTLQNPKHTFLAADTLNVRLTITAIGSSGILTHSSLKEISVFPSPIVDFTIVAPECSSNLFSFENKSTYNTTSAQYQWDFGNDLTFGTKNTSGKFAVGARNVNLTVTDLLGCSADTSSGFTVAQPVEKKPIVTEGNLTSCTTDSVKLTAPLSTSTYLWKKDGVALPNSGREVYASQTGKYTVEYVESGCTLVTNAVEIKVFELPNTSVVFENSGCEGTEQRVSLSNLNNSSYKVFWMQDGKALPFATASFTIPSQSAADNGLYEAIVEDSQTGCTYKVASANLVVNSNPVKPVVYSQKSSACFNEPISVRYNNSITGSYELSWYINNQFQLAEKKDTLVITPAHSSGIVKLSLKELSTGCVTVSDDFTFTFGKQIAPKLSGPVDACERTYASISVNAKAEEYDFVWYRGDSLLKNTLARMDFASLSKTDSGSYYAILTSKSVNGNVAGCAFITDSVKVNVKSAPEKPEIFGDLEYCQGNNTVLRSSVIQNLEWNTGEISDSIYVYKPGPYQVTVTDPTSGCKTNASVSVIENPTPDFRYLGTGVYEYCASEPLEISGLDAYASYQWKLNGNDFGKPNKDLYPRKSGNYTVEAITDKGCKAESDTLRLKSYPCACSVVTAEDGINIGSLRDAIYCANDKLGPDVIYFEIAGDGPHTIALDSVLPKITESVVIDGFSQSGEGVYDIIISGGQYKTSALVQSNSVTESEFRGLQFQDLDNAISLDFGCDDNVIEQNKFVRTSKEAVVVNGLVKNTFIRNNEFIGDSQGDAIRLGYFVNGQISNNQIAGYDRGIVLSKSTRNNIANNGISVIKQHAIILGLESNSNTISGNSILNVDSNAIAINTSTGNIIQNNYLGITKGGLLGRIGKNGIKVILAPGTIIKSNLIQAPNQNGVYADSSITVVGNTIQNAGQYGIYSKTTSLLKQNIISNSSISGVFIEKESVRIAENILTNSDFAKKGINLNGIGNQNKGFADFTKYEFLSNDRINIIGSSTPGDTVELFVTNGKPQQALKYAGRTVALANGTWSMILNSGNTYNPNTKNYYVNTASAGNNTSELSLPFTAGCATCICEVNNASDNGVGSFRAAVDSAHAGACRTIDFAISNVTISLDSVIRPIEVQLTVNGKPDVVINGSGSGSALNVNANDFNLKDLAFTNWDKGLVLAGNKGNVSNVQIDKTTTPVVISGDENKLGSSCLNCQSATTAFPISTAIIVSGNSNEIGFAENGNRIVGPSAKGIEISTGKHNSVLYTTISGSKMGIAHENSGNENYPSPIELAGVVDINKNANLTGKANPGDKIQVFLSNYLGKEATEFVAEVTTINGEFSISIPPNYIPANQNVFFIVSATGSNGNTSQFSTVVRIGDNTSYCPVTNTKDEGDGSLRAAVDCVNDAGNGKGTNAVIVFELPTTGTNTIEVLHHGFAITNNYGVEIDPGAVKVNIKSESTAKVPFAFNWEVDNVTLKNLTFEGFEKAISIIKGDTNQLSGNTFIGNDTAISVVSSAGVNHLTQNYFESGKLGVYVNSSPVEIRSNQFKSVLKDGVAVENTTGAKILWNNFVGLSERAIEIDQSKAIEIQNNTIKSIAATEGGILLTNSTESSLQKNTITGGKVGLLIRKSDLTKVWENTFVENSESAISLDSADFIDLSRNLVNKMAIGAKPIDLKYKSSNQSNHGLVVPVFTNATYYNGKVIYRGKATSESSVEIFETDTTERNLISYKQTVQSDRFGNFEYSISASKDHLNDLTVKATSTFNRNYFSTGISYTSEASAAFNPNLKPCFVDKESDLNEIGTLRYNINLANKNECNLILFEVPVAGDVNIVPQTDLPVITSSELTIDATSQPGYGGAPIVNLNDKGSFNSGFNVSTDGSLYIHGIELNGYRDPVQVSNVGYFESSQSVFTDFRNQGIVIESSKHKNIRLAGNTYSADVDYIWDFNKSNIYATGNILNGGKKNVARIEGDSTVIVNTKFNSSGGNSGYALLVQNADSVYMKGNTIGGFTSGAKFSNVTDLDFLENDFVKFNITKNQHVGIHISQCDSANILTNKIAHADTAIHIESSRLLHCDGNTMDSIRYVGTVLMNSAESSVSSNYIRYTPVGVETMNSPKSKLSFNTIFGHDSLGILVDKLSVNDSICGNTIGAPGLFSEYRSKGSAMLIYSSDNIIGGSESKGNKVLNNNIGGVLISGSTGNKITYNIFLNNDTVQTKPTNFAIWHKDNGNLLKEKPSITRFEEVQKNWKYKVFGMAEPNDSIHLYRSDGGYQNARVFAGKGLANGAGEWQVEVDTSNFDFPFVYNTLSIVATATDQMNNTSELSDIAYLGTCYINRPYDNMDNAYPLPNSFRQAVVCANKQPTKAEIYFFLNGGEGYTMYLQNEMLSLKNDSGAIFNGKNLVWNSKGAMHSTFGKDTILVQSGYDVNAADTTVFWRIARNSSNSQFNNLKLKYIDTALVIQSAHDISIKGFDFEGIQKAGIVLEDGTSNVLVDSNRFRYSVKGHFLKVNQGSKNITLSNSKMEGVEVGAIVQKASKVNFMNNKFNFLPTAVLSNETDSLYFEENEFQGSTKYTRGIVASQSQGILRKNTFDKYTIGVPVSISNSAGFTLAENEFKATTDTSINFKSVSNSNLFSNKFDNVNTYAVLLENCDSILLSKNEIKKIFNTGFEIRKSEKINLTQNLILQRDSAKSKQLINIYKNDNNLFSNIHKEEPVIEGYLVYKEDCEENKLGFYLYGTADSLDYIEIFESDTTGTVFKEFITSGVADSTGNWLIRIPKEKYKRKADYIYSYSTTGTGQVHNTSKESETFSFQNVFNEVVVTNTKDTGVGSLRNAVNEINCSFIHTVVYFNIDEPAPYRIMLNDSLPVLNAYRGFNMDGHTQSAYHDTLKLETDPAIFVNASAFPDTNALFQIHEECDSSAIANLTVENTVRPLKVLNSGNRLAKLYILNSTANGDTAIVVSGSSNQILNSHISGYKKGVYISGKSNHLKDDVIENVNLGIVIAGKDAYENKIEKSLITSDSVAIHLKELSRANFISKNEIGSVDKPLTTSGILLEKSVFQFVSANILPYGTMSETAANTAFIMVSDSSHYNTISKNRIGIDANAKVVLSGKVPGIKIESSKPDEILLGNNLDKNEIAGLKAPGIYIKNAEGGIISDNYVGVDSAFVQRENLDNFSKVSGTDSSSIIISNGSNMSVTGNTLVNFGKHGIDLRSSSEITLTQNRIFSEKSTLKGIQLNFGTAYYSNDSVIAPVIDTNLILSREKIRLVGSSMYPTSEVFIYEGFTPTTKDTVDHSLRYITSVISKPDGSWEVDLPSRDFGFNKYNKYIAQVNKGVSSSEYSSIYTLESLLCRLKASNIDLIGNLYEPCPGSQFKVDAQLEGLNYFWSAPQFGNDTIKTQLAQIDTSAQVTLRLTDNFGCVHEEQFEVKYKPKPQDPIYIVSTNTFVSDTIVLVDISSTRPSQYDWSSSDGLDIVSTSTTGSFTGPDGKVYPGGREVRFIAPDTGNYIMTQRSIRDGCFVSLDKEINVTHKIPGQPAPYAPDPGINNLYVYPSPFLSEIGGNMFISTTGEEEIEIEIIDMLGIKYYYAILSGKKKYNIPIGADDLPGNGKVYVLRMNTGYASFSYKFIVE